MKKKNYILVLIIIVLVALIVLVVMLDHCWKKKNSSRIVFSNGNIAYIEIANTLKDRARGLMYREALNRDSGMLFIFDDEKERSFWMKNTLIPLDIIFIDKDKIIVNIISAYPCEEEPCETYDSIYPVKYVLEVNLGYSEDKEIKIGDRVEIVS
jgi:uncharacterized protein